MVQLPPTPPDVSRVQVILLELIKTTLKPLVLIALFTAPAFYLIFYLFRLKKRRAQEAEDPFTELGLRPAGEALRLRAEALSDEGQETLMVHLLTGILSGLILAMGPGDKRIVGPFLGAIVLTQFLLSRRKLTRIMGELWNARLGYSGERAVGECLNSLLADGYQVFHDIPFENFNIDHVVVGPTGVFAIETKTRRKPKENGRKIAHKIPYDGAALHWPRYRDTESIRQAQANQDTLAKKLSDSTGERVPVQPIVTAPGWWIDDNNQHRVWALNPKRIRPFILGARGTTLSDSQVRRIIHQLQQLCQVKPATP